MVDPIKDSESTYKVFKSRKGDYAIRPAHQEKEDGWEDTGKCGSALDCITYISMQVRQQAPQPPQPPALDKEVVAPGKFLIMQAEQGLVVGNMPLLPTQRWLFDLYSATAPQWYEALMLEFKKPLQPSLVKEVVHQLLIQHDALRTRFSQEINGWQQVIEEPCIEMPFSYFDLAPLTQEEQVNTIQTTFAEQCLNLNLSQGPLVKVLLFDCGSQQAQHLLIIIHRLIIDAYSWSILMEDFQSIYHQLSNGKTVTPSIKTTSVKQWGERLLDYAQSVELHQELNYWSELPWSDIHMLPVDFPVRSSENTWESVDYISLYLSVEDTYSLLHRIPQATNIQVRDMLLTALAQTCTIWTGNNTVMISCLNHARATPFDDIDLSRTVGCIGLNHVPALLRIPLGFPRQEILKSVQRQLLCIPNYGLGYNILRYMNTDAAAAKFIRTIPMPELYFCYWSEQRLSQAGTMSHNERSPNVWHASEQIRPWLFYCGIEIEAKQLRITWEYSRNIHRRDTVKKIVEMVLKELQLFIETSGSRRK